MVLWCSSRRFVYADGCWSKREILLKFKIQIKKFKLKILTRWGASEKRSSPRT